MNKIIFGLLFAVSVLGMLLVMLTTHHQQNEPPRFSQSGPASPVSPPAALAGGSPAAPVPPSPQDLPSLPPLPDEPAVPSLPSPLPSSKVEPPAASPAPVRPLQPETTAAGTLKPDSAPARPEAPSAGAAGIVPSPITQPPKAEAAPARQQAGAATGRAEAAQPGKTAAAREKAPREKATARPGLSRFVVFARETGATVRMAGNQPIRYSHMQLENPPRVVVDLEGDWQMTAPGVPGNPMVSKVRVGRPDGKTRVVIDLKGNPRKLRMVQSADRKTLDVRVDK